MHSAAHGPGGRVPFEHAFAPEAAALPAARHRLERWLEDQDVPAPVADDLVTAASELCTNAIGAAEAEVVLRARVEADQVIIEVTDDGPGITADVPLDAPDPFADRGRGLFLVQQLVDVLWLTPGDDRGTVARAGRRLG